MEKQLTSPLRPAAEINRPTSLSLSEQEVHISWMRDQTFAKIYASDTTQITKFDKLCKTNPDMYVLEVETPYGKIYRCNDKTLISCRAKKREMSDEQKEAASQRFKEMWAAKDQ